MVHCFDPPLTEHTQDRLIKGDNLSMLQCLSRRQLSHHDFPHQGRYFCWDKAVPNLRVTSMSRNRLMKQKPIRRPDRETPFLFQTPAPTVNHVRITFKRLNSPHEVRTQLLFPLKQKTPPPKVSDPTIPFEPPSICHRPIFASRIREEPGEGAFETNLTTPIFMPKTSLLTVANRSP
ncbi:hypothetical protein RIF29_38069 [Crotalaria pallida]|uniref:Uncharacterized protein n=1 Tax=Crotalaria pallida TaxID=3830 RepID=A0AAN9DZG3_CROPI